ncbi:MAG TPA: inorganic diphosphatase [Lacipirellulaceae bacterium]|nr:inorganic diphosphatase [Lacipirellulaceae bacterium]
MPVALHKLPAWNEGELVNVVVECPKGCRNKYKFDEQAEVWRLSKILPLGACFPFDFGFIPSTRGPDGDPIDAIVLSADPAFPGCVLPARLIGVIEAEQTEHGKTFRNDRVVAVVETEHNPPPFQSLAEVPEWMLREIEHFFISYNTVEGRGFRVLGRLGPDGAERLVRGA